MTTWEAIEKAFEFLCFQSYEDGVSGLWEHERLELMHALQRPSVVEEMWDLYRAALITTVMSSLASARTIDMTYLVR